MSSTIPPDPLTLVYHSIVSAIVADEFVKSLHENKVIFLDFLPLPDMPHATTPPIPSRDMPRMSLMQDTALWGSNNSCTGRLDYVINMRIQGFGTRSVEINPLVFHLLQMIRPGHLDGNLRSIMYRERPLKTISRGGTATYDHDDERQFWTCTIPIEIQIYL